MVALFFVLIIPIALILFYIAWEMVRYNPQNTNTTKPLEDEDDKRTNT